MAGTFTKKKKCKPKENTHFSIKLSLSSFTLSSKLVVVECTGEVSGVYCDIAAWHGRDEEGDEQKCYFGIQTADRMIEFECRNKGEKQMWVDGIQQMLCCRMTMT